MIGVAGLGAMGLGIAQVFLAAGHEVVGTDAVGGARDAARDRLARALDARVAAQKLDDAARDAMLARFTVADAPEALAPAELIVEAVIEKFQVKHDLLARLAAAAPGAVLATNTSSLSVAALARGLPDPSRLLGLHFFNPAPAMRLVELVAHPGTAPDARARARALAEGAGKTVIDAPDRPGFVVNRVARPFYGEALILLEEGRTASDIDAAMLAVGYRMGPLALIDLVGADVHLAATRAVADAMGGHPRYLVAPALEAQVARGDLGRKSGRGFVHPDTPGDAPADAEALALRIEAAVVNEAAWLLAAGGTTRDAIDTALRLGLNWPRGPFETLSARGAPAIRSTLAALEATTPWPGRYAPAPLLEAP